MVPRVCRYVLLGDRPTPGEGAGRGPIEAEDRDHLYGTVTYQAPVDRVWQHSRMRELLDPLRHNSWATARLLEFCEGLPAEQLGATATGTYGTILSTLQHIVGAEGRYRLRLSDVDWDGSRKPEETEDLGELARMAGEVAA